MPRVRRSRTFWGTDKARRDAAFQPRPDGTLGDDHPRARVIAFLLNELRNDPAIATEELTRRLNAWNESGTRGRGKGAAARYPSGMVQIDGRYVAKLVDRLRQARAAERP